LNVDRFGLADPNKPAKANGEIFHIDFIDKNLPPCFRESKKLGVIATMIGIHVQ
jgi:hypothetical protein